MLTLPISHVWLGPVSTFETTIFFRCLPYSVLDISAAVRYAINGSGNGSWSILQCWHCHRVAFLPIIHRYGACMCFCVVYTRWGHGPQKPYDKRTINTWIVLPIRLDGENNVYYAPVTSSYIIKETFSPYKTIIIVPWLKIWKTSLYLLVVRRYVCVYMRMCCMRVYVYASL